MTGRRSRAFWALPCQPIQQLFGAQGSDCDPAAGTVLMALISHMAMNDGFMGVSAYHVSISQRELVEKIQLLKRKAVCNALARLEKRGHLTPIKVPSDGTRRGPNARVTYRIDLLADEATAFHHRGPSPEPTGEPQCPEKGPSYIQTESSDREQTSAPVVQESNGRQTGKRTWLTPYLEAWEGRYPGSIPNPGAMSKPLRALENRHGASEVVERWGYYLRNTTHPKPNAAHFAETYSDWDPARQSRFVLGHEDSDFFTADRV